MVGGFQLNGQFSHYSGVPFSVSGNSNTLGNFAPVCGAIPTLNWSRSGEQLSGHNRGFGSKVCRAARRGLIRALSPARLSRQRAWRGTRRTLRLCCPTRIAISSADWRQSIFNTSMFRAFRIYRETEFQLRFEAFNVLNHAWLTNPNTTVPSAANIAAGNYGTFGLITSYGLPPYSPTAGARSLQFSGRFNF